VTTVLHITFTDDTEAEHFAAMLKTGRGVVYKPHHATPEVDEPQSVTAVKMEREIAK
jgi:hypothetical protein